MPSYKEELKYGGHLHVTETGWFIRFVQWIAKADGSPDWRYLPIYHDANGETIQAYANGLVEAVQEAERLRAALPPLDGVIRKTYPGKIMVEITNSGVLALSLVRGSGSSNSVDEARFVVAYLREIIAIGRQRQSMLGGMG